MLVRVTIFAMLFICVSVRAEVKILRVPGGGIEPRAAIDDKGSIDLVYFSGDAAHGDLYYTHSTDDGKTFDKPVRINSQPGSAMAVGAVRGAQLAIGRDHRVHVAWMGSNLAEPKAPGNQTPMLYTRSDGHGGFEPQRNVITAHPGLDGGGSLAADDRGGVYIAWHAPDKPGTGEATRRVWIAESNDDGKTFSPEFAVTNASAGACGCCSLKIAATSDGQLAGLYRTCGEKVNRDSTFFTVAADHTSQTTTLAKMKVNLCIMSNFDLLPQTSGDWLASYETRGQLFLDRIASGRPAEPIAVGAGKYPAVAVNRRGETLVAFIRGSSWGKGGSLQWQTFDTAGKPAESGSDRDDQVWNYPAALATANGDFLILH